MRHVDVRRTTRLVMVGICVTATLAGPRAGASLDSTFGNGPNPGVVQFGPSTGSGLVGRAIASLPDGSIIAADEVGVRKYSASGVLDASFGQSGLAAIDDSNALDPTSVSIDGSGRIVVTGSRRDTGISPDDPVIVRLSASGVVDTGFAGAIDPYRFRVSRPIELGSKIVVATWDFSDGSVCLHRLLATNGELDNTFGGGTGHGCAAGLTTGFERVSGVYGYHRPGGGYTAYVPVQTEGGSNVAGSRIDIVDFDDAGVQQGLRRVIPAVPGEYLLSGQVSADGALLVSGQRNDFNDGFVRKYVNDMLDPNFAATASTPGVASLPGLRIERLTVLADGRIVASGSIDSTRAQARLLTADGRFDGALQPDAESTDRITLPVGSYSGWTPNGGTFVDATSSIGRVVLIGTETERSGFDTLHQSAIIAASDPLGPPSPISPTQVGSYTPVVPERLLDTRPDVQVGYSGPKPAGGATVRLHVTGVGLTQVPTTARAVVLNVTGTEATADGFVTVWPCGTERPLASNLNLVAGGTRPNVVVVGVGQGGDVCLFTQNGTHLIADLAGWFAASTSYTPTVPGRLLDTRPDTQVGYSGNKPVAGQVVELQVAGTGAHLAPAGSAGVVLNVTGTEVDSGTFVSVYRCNDVRPFVSNVNIAAGATASNSVIAPVGPGGKICLYTLNPAHLIVDISGWFSAGSSFAAVTPDRLLDTREQVSVSGYIGPKPVAAGDTVEVPVIGGRPGVPVDATAVILDVVGVDAGVPGFVTVWPCGTARPLASNLNLQPGTAGASLVVAGIGANGRVCVYTQNGAHLIVDIFGYIAPR